MPSPNCIIPLDEEAVSEAKKVRELLSKWGVATHINLQLNEPVAFRIRQHQITMATNRIGHYTQILVKKEGISLRKRVQHAGFTMESVTKEQLVSELVNGLIRAIKYAKDLKI